MSEDIKPGDSVTWSSSGGRSVGRVKKKLTAPTDIKGHHVAASPENPEFLVQSDKSGGKAAHKPGSLKKTAAKKSSANQTATKKAPAKKTVTKKTAAKKAVSKAKRA